jgi:hypothetical protein
MIRLSAATVLLQWSVGGLLFCWVTTRHRDVGLGYGWLLRGVFLVMAVGAFAVGRAVNPDLVRDGSALGVAVATGAALVVSVIRRKAGVAGQRQDRQRREARVAAMTGRDQVVRGEPVEPVEPVGRPVPAGREFPPGLDLLPPVIGVVGLVAAAAADGGPLALALGRTLAGAAFLGAITDAMLLGHWYLVQPGLERGRLNELVRWATIVWPFEVAALLWPTGMPAVLSRRIKDGYGGMLGWFWVACAITTLGLCLVTRAALKERYYSAVMSATGLLYLAILTGFGTDLVARAVLAK